MGEAPSKFKKISVQAELVEASSFSFQGGPLEEKTAVGQCPPSRVDKLRANGMGF
jgi:hypothetical protein